MLAGFEQIGLAVALASVAHASGAGIRDLSEYSRETIIKNCFAQNRLSLGGNLRHPVISSSHVCSTTYIYY